MSRRTSGDIPYRIYENYDDIRRWPKYVDKEECDLSGREAVQVRQSGQSWRRKLYRWRRRIEKRKRQLRWMWKELERQLVVGERERERR